MALLKLVVYIIILQTIDNFGFCHEGQHQPAHIHQYFDSERCHSDDNSITAGAQGKPGKRGIQGLKGEKGEVVSFVYKTYRYIF